MGEKTGETLHVPMRKDWSLAIELRQAMVTARRADRW